MKNLPASSFSDDSGKGTINKHRITCKMWDSVVSGVQSRFSVLTQISPLSATLGWKMRVRK